MLINVNVAGRDPDPNRRGEGQLPNPNECNSDTNPDECNSDNIFWKWEMGKWPYPQKKIEDTILHLKKRFKILFYT